MFWSRPDTRERCIRHRYGPAAEDEQHSYCKGVSYLNLYNFIGFTSENRLANFIKTLEPKLATVVRDSERQDIPIPGKKKVQRQDRAVRI